VVSETYNAMNSNSPFSAHSDILDAPLPSKDDPATRLRLVEECKSRGKAAVQAGHWPDAAALYGKALECYVGQDSDTAKTETAILYSNVSLVRGKMSQWSMAQEAAQQAVQADQVYVKGWWRLGQAESAMGNYTKSVEALQQATKLEPDNKALQKELTKQEEKAKKAAEEKKKEADTPAEMRVNEPQTIEKKAAATNSNSTPSSTAKTKEDDSAMQVDIDGTDFSKSEHIRGYKIVNGKKTSFFHNELSEDAARLIGDIAPKKLDADTGSSSTAAGAKGTSAWNQAGTWEEKDVTNWAKTSLRERLLATTYTLPESSPAPGALVLVTEAKVTGNASCAAVRGKKRYIYELCVTLDWSFSHGDHQADGSIVLPDVDGTCVLGDGYEEANWKVDRADDPSMRPLLETFVHKQGWREAIHETIDDWVRHFKDTY
jgi:tetratricopeptide (TPR) repeat protein